MVKVVVMALSSMSAAWGGLRGRGPFGANGTDAGLLRGVGILGPRCAKRMGV